MTKKLTKFVLILSFLTVCTLSYASSLEHRINSVVNGSKVRKVVFGVQVIDADSAEILYSHNAEKPLIPASNMKLVTSAAALHYLGKDYEYKTRVYLSGNDLIIVGSGDPLFGDDDTDSAHGKSADWQIAEIINALKAKNVKWIKNVIVDSSVFDDNRTHPSWPRDQLNRYYACQVSGLNYNGNCIDVNARSDGKNVHVATTPKTSYVNIVNRAKPTLKRPNTLWCSRPFESNVVTLYGKCYKKSMPIRVTVDRPASFFGFHVAECLIGAGIEFRGQIFEQFAKDRVKDSEPIAEFVTPLSDVLKRCNRDSFGLAAESMIKTISSHMTAGKVNGEWVHGQKLIEKYLKQLEIDESQFCLDDGSGLSRKNEVSAYLLSCLILNLYHSDNWELFKDSLAIGGVCGSSPVRSYFREEKYKGKIFAKSGTINGVKALSGYCVAGEKNYIFSIITNKANWYSRRSINNIVKAIMDCKE